MKAAIDAEETEKRQLEAEKQKIEERLQVQIREAAIKVIFFSGSASQSQLNSAYIYIIQY